MCNRSEIDYDRTRCQDDYELLQVCVWGGGGTGHMARHRNPPERALPPLLRPTTRVHTTKTNPLFFPPSTRRGASPHQQVQEFTAREAEDAEGAGEEGDFRAFAAVLADKK